MKNFIGLFFILVPFTFLTGCAKYIQYVESLTVKEKVADKQEVLNCLDIAPALKQWPQILGAHPDNIDQFRLFLKNHPKISTWETIFQWSLSQYFFRPDFATPHTRTQLFYFHHKTLYYVDSSIVIDQKLKKDKIVEEYVPYAISHGLTQKSHLAPRKEYAFPLLYSLHLMAKNLGFRSDKNTFKIKAKETLGIYHSIFTDKSLEVFLKQNTGKATNEKIAEHYIKGMQTLREGESFGQNMPLDIFDHWSIESKSYSVEEKKFSQSELVDYCHTDLSPLNPKIMTKNLKTDSDHFIHNQEIQSHTFGLQWENGDFFLAVLSGQGPWKLADRFMSSVDEKKAGFSNLYPFFLPDPIETPRPWCWRSNEKGEQFLIVSHQSRSAEQILWELLFDDKNFTTKTMQNYINQPRTIFLRNPDRLFTEQNEIDSAWRSPVGEKLKKFSFKYDATPVYRQIALGKLTAVGIGQQSTIYTDSRGEGEHLSCTGLADE